MKTNERCTRLPVVLVGGLFSEFLGLKKCGSYLEEVKLQLLSQGAPEVVKYLPFSLESEQSRIDSIRNLVKTLAFKHNRQVVLIGHSRGGFDVFLSLCQHPELMKNDLIAKCLTVQAPFGGSSLARFLVPRLTPKTLRQFIPKVCHAELHRHFSGLSFEDKLLLKNHCLNVTGGHQKRAEVSGFLRPTFGLLKQVNPFVPNDGMLQLEDQKAPKLIQEEYFLMDHGRMMLDQPVSAAGPEEKAKFLASLI